VTGVRSSSSFASQVGELDLRVKFLYPRSLPQDTVMKSKVFAQRSCFGS
jgi:hypothetical protein